MILKSFFFTKAEKCSNHFFKKIFEFWIKDSDNRGMKKDSGKGMEKSGNKI